jgi:hypothetical protein
VPAGDSRTQVNEFEQYAANGWKLCAIGRGSKSPTYDDWNTPEKLEETTAAAEGLEGAGLAHAASGTCAIDIDNLASARAWLAERGVDIDALLNAQDAVRITSGRPGRAKLLYRMNRPLRTIQPRGVGLELRCGTAGGKSMQDVLPPTLHPDTDPKTKKPYQYRWEYGEPLIGDWRKLPPIPSQLLALWRELLATEPEATVKTNGKHEPPQVAIALERLEKVILKRRDPNCEYLDWIKVGSQLHHEGGGSQEAFDIWKNWSKQATRRFKDSPGEGSPYPGDDVLLTHWHSFSSTPGKIVATGGSLIAEETAEAEEFEVVQPTPEADNTEQKMILQAKQTRAKAIKRLEDRVVFVYSAERYFDTERHRVIGSDSALEHMFTHMMPRNKGGRISPIKTLKESPTKRFVDGLAFHPGEGVIFKGEYDTYANLYRNRLPEPLEPTAGELERIEWMFDRIDDPLFRTWLLDFYSHVVQYPGVKIKSAPLIWSDTQGNGKTTLLKMVPSLLVGAQYSTEVTCALLNSDFNDYLLNAWHVNLTEFRAGTRGDRIAITEKLKPLITDDVIALHPKGGAAYPMPNRCFVTGSSNQDDAASIDNNDRRWAVHEMHAAQFTESEQEWLYTDFLLTPRAAGVLRHYFLNRTIENFSPSAKAPETEARQAMVAASTTSDTELLELAWEERSGLFEKDVVLTGEVTSYVHKHVVSKPSVHRVGRMLRKPPFNGQSIQFRVGEKSFRAVILFNHRKWKNSSGKAIMAHIEGEDLDSTR